MSIPIESAKNDDYSKPHKRGNEAAILAHDLSGYVRLDWVVVKLWLFIIIIKKKHNYNIAVFLRYV